MRVPVDGKNSWKKREVGKSGMKLERIKLKSSVWCWKVRAEVVKFWFNLERFNEVEKLPLKLKIQIDTRKGSLVEKGSWKTDKLESFCLSWKEPSKVWKNQAKLEIVSEVKMYRCSWKFLMNFETCHDSWKVSMHFIIESFQN